MGGPQPNKLGFWKFMSSILSLSILMAIPVWMLLELRMMEVVVRTGAIRCAKLQSSCHHQQTDTQLLTGWMPFLSPNQQCQSAEGKMSHFADFITAI